MQQVGRQTGLCGERIETPLAHDTWTQIREEAVSAVEHDRVMREVIRDTVLSHETFGDALAHRVARKLADYALSIESLEGIVCEAFATDPDIEAAALADLNAVRDRDPASPDLLTPFLFFKGYLAIQSYRFAHFLWKRGRLHLAKHLQSRSSDVFGVDIHPAARLGRGIMIDHGTGVVVGETAIIDDDVSLLQGVTLGGTGKHGGDRHPKIRRGVLLGAGAKILGNITVGEGAKVGAGSVVLENVLPFTTVVGNPARIVGTRHTYMPALTMDQGLPPLDYAI
ncbi:MAG: serine O-acetyltransferase [Rhodospirillales bacterium]